MNPLKKKILVLSESLYTKLKNILGETLYEFFLESDENEKIDYTFIESWHQKDTIEGKGILIGPCSQMKVAIEGNVAAVIHPAQLDHEVGQVSLKRLLGENSSLGLEVVFQKSKIQFKNFRLMDHLMMGHYSDVLAREAYLKGFKPLPIRNFFDSMASFLYQFEVEKRVSFPYDVDFGIWDDLFVMQIHCSAEEINIEDIASGLGEYKIENPQMGSLRLALSQTDALDIYQLKASQRLVLCAQWFHPLRKKQISNPFPSFYLHEVEKYSSYKGTIAKTLLSPLPKFNRAEAKNDVLQKVVHKLNQMDVEELTRVISGGENSEEAQQTVKGWLDFDDSNQMVSGRIDEDDSSQIVSGRIDEDDSNQMVSGRIDEDESVQIVKGGEEKSIEEVWRIKRDQIINTLGEKLVVSGGDGENSSQALQKVLESVFDTEASDLSNFVNELVSETEDVDSPEVKPRWDFEAKRLEQDLIKKDAQLLRMKKLIDRLKLELQARQIKSDIAPQVEHGTTLLGSDTEVARLTEELKKQETLHEKAKALIEQQLKTKDQAYEKLEAKLNQAIDEKHELQQNQQGQEVLGKLTNENENLKNQIEVSKKRITQMSDTILNNSKNLKDKESSEITHLKEAMIKAQQAIKGFQKELSESNREILKLEAKNKELLIQVEAHNSEESIAGPSAEQLKVDEAEKELSNVREEFKELKSEMKNLVLENKKLEQKNRFMAAQLESAQKKGQVVANKSQNGDGMSDAQATKKVRQLEKVVEVMKDNESKVQQDLISKKDELQKMKAESVTLKNKIGELERKLQKYEKEAA